MHSTPEQRIPQEAVNADATQVAEEEPRVNLGYL